MKWRGQTVVVTGGTGFIGSFLVERLLDAGATVRVPVRAQNYRALSARRAEIDWREGDLRDPDFCQSLIRGCDRIFHLASCRRNAAYHVARCGDIAQENVRMTIALLEAMREEEMNVPVTFFSTANVPPELDVLSLDKQKTVDGYVLGKALCEALWFAAVRQRGFPLLILRPVGVYGPRDTFTEEGNVIPAFFVRAQKSKEALDVWGTGDQERAFLYVEDLVDALLKLADADARGVQYVSSNQVVTIRELAEMIRDLVKPALKIRYHPEKHLGPRTMPLLPPHASIKKMRWTPFAKGLKATYEQWMRKETMIA